MEEKVINTDLCVICSAMLDENCSRLTIALEFTQKPIYILIGERSLKFSCNLALFIQLL